VRKKIVISSLLWFAANSLYAQQNDSSSQLLNLPLEKLMDIPIYSASKYQETSFEAPLSSSVVTREQIRNSGVTTIMEALRLLPGVLVREQTNGNYDIHILGLDNVPPNSSLIFFANSTTLVMIDNRPVYNYLHGGTFWETLPITLNDVERIELVRGPCAAMYGPNAVSGVINIITRAPEKQGAYANAKVLYGSYNSLITHASYGYKFNDKVSAWASLNFQQRNRTQSDYYDVVQDKYVPLDSVTAVKNALKTDPTTLSKSYPDPSLSMRKYGYNGFVNYDPTEKMHFALSFGGQNSEVQNEFGSGLAYISTFQSSSNYADLKARVHGFDVQVSELVGTEYPVLGQSLWKWDFASTDVNVEYKYDKIKNLTLTPGLMYRLAVYDDTKYIDEIKREGFWSGKARTECKAVSLRGDYRLFDDKLRITAAGRLDEFNYPVKTYFSYEMAATYKIDQHNLVRISEGRANRTPLLIDLYSDLDLTGPFPITNPNQTYLLQIRGNKNIRLLTSDMLTLGYRTVLKENLSIDLEVFYAKTKDFSNAIFQSGAYDSTGPVSFTGLLQFDNIAVHTEQYGTTITVDYTPGKWQIKPYITIQQTTLFDYSPYNNSANAPPLSSNNYNPGVYNTNWGIGTKMNHQATPTWFGGLYTNYTVNKKLNLNLNAYALSTYTQLESDNLTYHSGTRGIEQVPTIFLVNLAGIYKVNQHLNVSVNLRNILNDGEVEFYKGDAPGFMIFGGLSFQL
jgi:iron complex outermembrane recepter protein